MIHYHVSIQVRKQVRRRHLLPWVLQSFNVQARTPAQAVQQARVRANLLGLDTQDCFMCTALEAA